MVALLEEASPNLAPEGLVQCLADVPGVVLLRSGRSAGGSGRYSFVTARPFLTFRSLGWSCQLQVGREQRLEFGNPWQILDALLSRYELLDKVDLPFPLGGCFGFWGYDLKNSLEPRLPRRANPDLELPDCHLGFYSSVVVFDHSLHRTWMVNTGLNVDGSRDEGIARADRSFWRDRLEQARGWEGGEAPRLPDQSGVDGPIQSNFSQAQFLRGIERILRYIQAGDIYQANLAQRFSARTSLSAWELYRRMSDVSPAPFAAYLQAGEFQIVSSSPELFLRMSGGHIRTRPIKGTRPRSADPTRDTQLTYELQTSPKEMAELVMITDLLRNDLGKVCEYGSVHVPELACLERYATVQHLVSTVDGQLRKGMTHLAALASCFPGGSITGAPKIRAMEIIDELEPVRRGPYTGALGYLGFNRESQLSILIRAAVLLEGTAHYHAGAGIVADSQPLDEYEETRTKARGFFEALHRPNPVANPWPIRPTS